MRGALERENRSKRKYFSRVKESKLTRITTAKKLCRSKEKFIKIEES
jgi:hypothetical protein